MSLSKEISDKKLRKLSRIIAAGFMVFGAHGVEANHDVGKILQEVPTPIVIPEETVEEVAQEEQEPQSGIQATIPPTPEPGQDGVVLIRPTPDATALRLLPQQWYPNYDVYIENIRNAQLEIVQRLPAFNEAGYQTFTFNHEPVPFGMINSSDVNIYFESPEQMNLSTHVVSITNIERRSFSWPGYPQEVDTYLFVTFQSENLTMVVSYSSDYRGAIPNISAARAGDLSSISSLRLNGLDALEARYRQAMTNREQVIVQFWNTLQAAGYQSGDAAGQAWEHIQTTANDLLIDAIETGNVSPQAGVETPDTVIFLNQ